MTTTTMTIPFTECLGETWLLERTYHAQLRNGKELSIPEFTQAMKQIAGYYVPLSTWKEATQEEARAAYQQGGPVLLYGEHSWDHPKGAAKAWGANRNMRVIIYGNALEHPEVGSGTDYAVCFFDPQEGAFSNASWRTWFSSDRTLLFDGDPGTLSTLIFLVPWLPFPSSSHYTVIASDGSIYEHADRAESLKGFLTLPARAVSNGSGVQTLFPQFCYYHDVTCPDGVYRLEFFGPRMDEQGYQVKEADGKE
ncbi:MAG TPA: hypothetical protein VKU38_00515 [Ktedonobacteraceae bacterium]|nr:hypothetical protein [Ktedonobacteraceae bacterium]